MAEVDKWESDHQVTKCNKCEINFSLFKRKHHCRICGKIFCNDCCNIKSPIPEKGYYAPVRICMSCYNNSRNIRKFEQENGYEFKLPLIFDYFILPRHNLLGNQLYPSPIWFIDSKFSKCPLCEIQFSFTNRRHHCRNCGLVICNKCSLNKYKIEMIGYNTPVRICNKCHVNLSSQSLFIQIQNTLLLKIGSYLDPLSICRLSQVNFKTYTILSSEDADKVIWQRFTPTKTNDDAVDKSVNDSYGRYFFNLYLMDTILKRDYKFAFKFFSWPNQQIRETAGKFILAFLLKNYNGQKEFYDNGYVEKLVNFFINITDVLLGCNNVAHLKFAELLTGCIMNACQFHTEVSLKIKHLNGIPTLLRFLTNTPPNDAKYSKIREYTSGALWNITNSGKESSIELGDIGGIMILTPLLTSTVGSLSYYVANILCNLGQFTQNKEKIKLYKSLPTILKSLERSDLCCVLLSTIRNCINHNSDNLTEFRKLGGLAIVLDLLTKTDQNNGNTNTSSNIVSNSNSNYNSHNHSKVNSPVHTKSLDFPPNETNVNSNNDSQIYNSPLKNGNANYIGPNLKDDGTIISQSPNNNGINAPFNSDISSPTNYNNINISSNNTTGNSINSSGNNNNISVNISINNNGNNKSNIQISVAICKLLQTYVEQDTNSKTDFIKRNGITIILPFLSNKLTNVHFWTILYSCIDDSTVIYITSYFSQIISIINSKLRYIYLNWDESNISYINIIFKLINKLISYEESLQMIKQSEMRATLNCFLEKPDDSLKLDLMNLISSLDQ